MPKPYRIAVLKGAALAVAGCAVVPFAAAQDAVIDVAALQEVDDDRTDVTHEGFSIEQIEDMNVVRNGEVIGEVEAVLADASGSVSALAVEVRGLGGDDDVVVPIDQVRFLADRREVETSLGDDELAALPRWND
ncbi:MAG TPA: PRC-barrel domain-containing protein [Gammaproteobacteria bacterium]